MAAPGVQTFRRLARPFVALMVTIVAGGAFAGDTGPKLPTKRELKGAVTVQLTKKGQGRFANNLNQFLGNLGFDFSEGHFDAIEYASDKPVNLDDLARTMPEEAELLKKIRDLLTKWFVGFPLNDHRPAVRLGPSDYQATFNRFGAVVDPALLKKLGRKDGAVLAIELEVKNIKATAENLRAWDANNEHLGQVGFDGLEISLGSAEMPVKIRAPFYVRVDDGGILRFEALDLTENLDQVPIEVKYEKLVVPTVVLTVNGRSYQLNNEELENYVNANMPKILQIVRQQLSSFVKKELPAMLNEKARSSLSGVFEQTQKMRPPGADTGDKRPDFLWGLILKSINQQSDGGLRIGLSGWVEDPTLATSPALVPGTASRAAPELKQDTSTYDLALTVDRSLINRVLQLSYQRKNFERIAIDGSKTLKLAAAPTVDFVARPADRKADSKEAWIKLSTAIEYSPDGFVGSIALKDKAVIGFDIIARLRQADDRSGLRVVLHSVDLDSIRIDPNALTGLGSLFAGSVRQKVRDEMAKISAPWAKGTQTIPGKLEFPPKVFGLTLDLAKVEMDPNGHLTMYTAFQGATK